VISQASLMQAREEILALHLAEPVEQYIVELVMASRDPSRYSLDLGNWIEYGASPRASIALNRCARAHAWLQGRDYVTPEDVQQVAPDVLRHRLLLSFEAEANGMTADDVIRALLQWVPVA